MKQHVRFVCLFVCFVMSIYKATRLHMNCQCSVEVHHLCVFSEAPNHLRLLYPDQGAEFENTTEDDLSDEQRHSLDIKWIITARKKTEI